MLFPYFPRGGSFEGEEVEETGRKRNGWKDGMHRSGWSRGVGQQKAFKTQQNVARVLLDLAQS